MAGVTTAMATSYKAELLGAMHCHQGQVTPTGNTTSASASVTSVSSMTGVVVGMGVSGTGIASNSTVIATSASGFTLSANATATGTGTTLTIVGDTFKCALFVASPTGTYGAATTNYSQMTTDELATGSGYTAGGVALTCISPATSGTTAYTDFGSNPSWTTATFSTSGCMFYNSSVRSGTSGRTVSVHSFGGTQAVTSGTFTILLPTPGVSTSHIRIGP